MQLRLNHRMLETVYAGDIFEKSLTKRRQQNVVTNKTLSPKSLIVTTDAEMLPSLGQTALRNSMRMRSCPEEIVESDPA